MIQIREAKAEDQNEVARLIEQLEEAPVHQYTFLLCFLLFL